MKLYHVMHEICCMVAISNCATVINNENQENAWYVIKGIYFWFVGTLSLNRLVSLQHLLEIYINRQLERSMMNTK